MIPGRTRTWAHATCYADARATAERLAQLICNPCAADFTTD